MKKIWTYRSINAGLRRWRGYGFTALLAVVLATLVGWLGDGLKGETLFCAWSGRVEADCRAMGWHWFAMAGCAAAIVALLALGRNLFSRLGGVEELSSVEHRPSRAMVALFSSPNHARIEFADDAMVVQLVASQPGERWPAGSHVEETLAELDGKNFRWNWIPLLRAINTHGAKLETVMLIGSTDSAKFVGEFRRVLQTVMGEQAPEVRLAKLTPSFSDLDQVRQAIKRELADMSRLEGPHGKLQPEDIVINVTGGTKTAGIAAAVAAMDHGASLEYSENKELLTYRIVAQRWQAFQ